MAKNKGTHGRGKEAVEEPDEFVQRVSTFSDVIAPHIKKIAAVGVLCLAGLSAWKFMDWKHEGKAADATTAYLGAMKVVDAPVIAPDEVLEGTPADEKLHFGTEEARRAAGLQALGKVSDGYGEIALSKLAVLGKARLLLDSDKFDEAMAQFKKFSQSEAPETLRMAALEGVAYCIEGKAMANDDAEARQAGLETALASFASLQPAVGGPMRDYSLYHQGRVLVAMGKTREGIAMFKQVLSEEPDSPLKSDIDVRLADLEDLEGGDAPQ